ncbi:MAG: plasmid pRiA4b ORF-3 family protein [Verrucomicrobia bacterium]|nr:plasmid pRiA4b ORF-3 family protein [Verrucomicrobiota bacterium]MDA1006041.1 plasmid pRiA4b ORF-3 family protein [Verrucomicrobiota bacterium]
MPEMSEDLREELFGLAYKVRQSEPWEEYCDQDWYGVRDPETGELQIVSILGMDGKVFALQLYLPEEGIRFWNGVIATGELNQNAALFDLRMIECEFCGKDGLPEEDLEWNEQFPPEGVRKGTNGYVSFRSHRPEHYPWFIEEEEGRMLANALRLLPVFGEFTEHVEEEAYYNTRRGENPRIPIFGLKEGGDPRDAGDWKGSVSEFPIAPPKVVPEVPRDDVFHARMGKLKTKKGTTWEIGSFFLPGPAPVGGRLVYPTLTVTAPHESLALPAPLIGSPTDCRMAMQRKSFAAMAEEKGYLPETLLVASPLTEAAFEELAASSGLEILPLERLPNLNTAVEALVNSITGRTEDGVETPVADGMMEAGESEYREPTCPARFVMRIDLVGAKPPIWRRISMPVDASFFDLHVAIQDAMGWQDCHLHNFEIRNGRDRVALIEWNPEGEDLPMFGLGVEQLPELQTTLFEVVERGFRKIHYCYDFGDNWEHQIQIEDVVDPKVLNPLPELLKGRGACPPEDCGGIWGYQELLGEDSDYTEDWDPEQLKAIREAKFDPQAVEFTRARETYERWLVMRDL